MRTWLIGGGLIGWAGSVVAATAVHMATGFKVTEVDANSATVWTRLTTHADRNRDGHRFARDAESVPRGRTLADMIDSAAGASGEVRVIYSAEGLNSRATPWQKVDPEADHTRQFRLLGLNAGTRYAIQVEGRPAGVAAATVSRDGGFRTPAAADIAADVSFTVVTGQDYDRRDDRENGHKIFRVMRGMEPDFFVHTGDVVYYDKPNPWAKNEELARYKWQATYSMPFQREFHQHVASYFMRDDHDITKNDSWPGKDYGDLTWERGLEIFREQTGLPELPYRTIRWGRDLQVWLTAGRQFRSPNTMPDGPDKSIWGEQQKRWFFNSVRNSDATFRVLVNSTPLVGPDRGNKNDNHANVGFTHEGDELRRFIGQQENMYVVCGDRHWQYVSVDPVSGVTEYSCGPTSDKHAGGWSERNRSDMHKYLQVKGGFLRVRVTRQGREPRIEFEHFGVAGQSYHKDVRTVN